MSLIERINQKATEKGLNIKQLEQLSGLSNGQIGKWKKQKPSYDKVESVANSLNVSIDWLITGKEHGELTDEEKKLVDYYRIADSRGKRNILRTAEAEADNGEQSDQISTSKIG